MKVTKYYCDVCNKESTISYTRLSFEGYYSDTLYGNIINVIDHCCTDCRKKIITNVQEIVSNTIKQIQRNEEI